MRAEDVHGQRGGGIRPGFGDLRQPGAMKDRRWIQLVDSGSDGIAIEQIDGLPFRESRDLRRRSRPCPADDSMRRGKQLNEMAAREPGGAGNENRTVHSYFVRCSYCAA